MFEDEKVLFIDIHSSATRVALVEDGDMQEFLIEKTNQNKMVGNIYKGRVMNVLNGMQAAFVNIGLDKNAYLYVGDSLVDKSELEGVVDKSLENNQLTVKNGDVVMVQVVKEQNGTKGARVTSDVTVPGRFLVYMPYVDYIGISRKIEDVELREKLYKTVDSIRDKKAGFIVRTAAATATVKEIKQDAKFLIDTFNMIQKKYNDADVPACVYDDGDLLYRTIRDVYTTEISKIIVNNTDAYQYVKNVLEKIAPKNKTEIVLTENTVDMFKEYKIDGKVEALLQKKVWLSNGAYLIIDKTEALTVIDVNTGKYVGKDNLEETVFITNMLASREIARQLRLRNIGGIVVVDFIDMHNEEHRNIIIEELNKSFKKDRIKSTVVGMTSLGLVEITRKKSRNETSTILMQKCPYCNGDAVVYSNQYILMKIRVALLDALRDGSEACLVSVHPKVFESIFKQRLLSGDVATIWNKKRIYIVPKESLHIKDFSIEVLEGDILTLPSNAQLLY